MLCYYFPFMFISTLINFRCGVDETLKSHEGGAGRSVGW